MSSGFSFKPTSSSSSSSSTQFSQEWTHRKVVIKHSIQSYQGLSNQTSLITWPPILPWLISGGSTGGSGGVRTPPPLMGQHPISRDPTSPDLVNHKCKFSYLKFLYKLILLLWLNNISLYIPYMNIHWDTMVYPQHAHPSHPQIHHCRSGE